MNSGNLFDNIPPEKHQDEIFQSLSVSKHIRIERIISQGHKSADGEWYDSERAEWVALLDGEAELEFEGGTITRLIPGDYVNIPPHCRHRVTWTSAEKTCIWLAVHFE